MVGRLDTGSPAYGLTLLPSPPFQPITRPAWSCAARPWPSPGRPAFSVVTSCGRCFERGAGGRRRPQPRQGNAISPPRASSCDAPIWRGARSWRALLPASMPSSPTPPSSLSGTSRPPRCCAPTSRARATSSRRWARPACGAPCTFRPPSSTGGGAARYRTRSHALRATDVRVNRFNVYGVSKTRAENEVRAICARLGIALTTVRPNGIYGAFDHSGFTYWFRRLVSPRLAAPFPANMRLDLVYAGDVAEAIAALPRTARDRRQGLQPGRRRRLGVGVRPRLDGKPAARRSRLLIPVPLPLFQRFDCRRAREDLGWRQRSLVEGIRDLLRLEAESRKCTFSHPIHRRRNP